MPKRPVPYQQAPGGPWWIAFQIGGKRKKIGLRTTSRAEADRLSRDIFDRAVAESTMERLAEGKVLGRSKDMPLDMAIAKFWKGHVVAEGLKGPDEIWRRLTNINTAIGPDTMVTAIDDQKIKAYRNARTAVVSERTGRTLSPNTVQGELREIKRLLTHVEKELKVQLPVINWRKIMIPESRLPQRTRTLSPAESVLILDALGPDYRAIIGFALASGMRLRGLVNTTWADIHWSNRTIQYLQKGDRFAAIHVTQEIEAIFRQVEQYQDGPDSPVFTFKSRKVRKPITYSGLSSHFSRVIVRLKLPHATIHDLRRTFLSDFVDSTNDVVSASKAAGHASPAPLLKHYLRLPPKHVRDAADTASAARLKARSVLEVA